MFGPGGILPAIGLLGSGFSGGGIYGLGFTLLGGLLNSLTKPRNLANPFPGGDPALNNPHPGFNNLLAPHPGFGGGIGAPHPGFGGSIGSQHPGFGGVGAQHPSFGGVHAHHPGFGVGASQANHHHYGHHYNFGGLQGGPSAHTVGSMSGYFGHTHSHNGYPTIPPTSTGQYQANASYSFGSHGINYAAPPTQEQINAVGNQLHAVLLGQPVSGNTAQYQQNFQQSFGGYASSQASYQSNQTMAYYGGTTAPWAQSGAPMTGHYTVGAPQQYNPAATLYGHQNGSVSINYSPTVNYSPHFHGGYGGPQPGGGQHHHHHHHYHIHPQPTPDPAHAPDPAPAPAQTYPPTTPPVAATPPAVPAQAQPPAPTSWSRVPHINGPSDLARASQLVGERITDGDNTRYRFAGRDPHNNTDGMRSERMGAWHVFQQNESLRLDMKTGNYYETRPDGSKFNRFHSSAIADLERQSGGDRVMAGTLIGDFLNQHGLWDGAAGPRYETAGSPPNTTPQPFPQFIPNQNRHLFMG